MLRDKADGSFLISGSHVPLPLMTPKQALAGTGTPTKELVWRVSLLNLARRNAENTEIKNAK